MAKSKIRKRAIPEEEIDNLVESQADNNEAWEEPIQVRRKQEDSFSCRSEDANHG